MTGAYAQPFPSRSARKAYRKRHFDAMTRHRHGGPGFGPGDFGGRGFGPGSHRRRMRRGDVRAAILVLLAEQPYNGYGLMQEIETRSEGVWRPSPGSVYPALAQLEDEGLVVAEMTEGRKAFALTDAGKAHVEEHREKLGEPWADLGREVGQGRMALRALIGQLAAAAIQVSQVGSDEQIARAGEILVDARKALYRLRASDEETDAS
jgi:DNA-binding PadR family transcriptional regulator